MLQSIRSHARALLPQLIEIRRHLHAHPELSGNEHQTATYIAGVLSDCGLRTIEGVGKTGVVGELQRDRGPWLAIRTDMDALPIVEGTGASFASRYQGIMHACGHDLHATIGLGTAIVLSHLPKGATGNLRFLFQPAEETARGASWMIEDGVLEKVAAILGVHAFPSILAGKIGVRCGALTAAADDVEIEILGEAGHGARPHEAIDAIWIAAQVVTALQQAIARTQNPLRPVVLTVGQIKGGRAPNVIADRVKMVGTVRSLHADTRAELPAWIERIVTQTCETYGARGEVKYHPRIGSVQNDPALTQLIEAAAREALGSESVEILPEPSLGAEDFAAYLDLVPGTLFRLGVGWRDRPNYPLHHPQFEPDESAILTGVIILAHAACKYWQQAGDRSEKDGKTTAPDLTFPRL